MTKTTPEQNKALVLENGQLAEHRDVIQDEVTKEASVSADIHEIARLRNSPFAV